VFPAANSDPLAPPAAGGSGGQPQPSGGGNTPSDGSNGQPSPSDSQLAAARFYNPRGITFDAEGNLYVVNRVNLPDHIDSRGHDMIRKITRDGTIANLGNSAYEIYGVAAGLGGNVYYAEPRYDRVVKLTADGSASVFAGGVQAAGVALGGELSNPMAVASDAQGNLYIADTGSQLIRKVTPEGVATIGAGQTAPSGTPGEAIDGARAEARFARPLGIAVDAAGDLYVLDSLSGSFYDPDRDQSFSELTLVRKVTASAGTVTTIAGQPQSWGQSDNRGLHGSWGPSDAVGLPPRFSDATGITVDAAGNIYVTDGGHAAIRKVTSSGNVSTLAGGQNGNPFRSPAGVTMAANGDLYVTDSARYVIYKVTQEGQVTVFAGKEDDHGLTASPL
jgi:sugar lactone lactonase YvrE